MKYLLIALSFGAIVTAAAASAQVQDHAQHEAPGMHSEPAQRSFGEIIKVDKEAAKITIKHGPLLNLRMPSMTMAFKLRNPVMLSQVKAGDKVGFVAENVNGVITVTTLEAAK